MKLYAKIIVMITVSVIKRLIHVNVMKVISEKAVKIEIALKTVTNKENVKMDNAIVMLVSRALIVQLNLALIRVVAMVSAKKENVFVNLNIWEEIAQSIYA